MLVFGPGGLGLRAFILKCLLFGDYIVLEAIPLGCISEKGIAESRDGASFLKYSIMSVCGSPFSS